MITFGFFWGGAKLAINFISPQSALIYQVLGGLVIGLVALVTIDTKVCEAQTHYLAEEGDRISPNIRRITISRDTPFAQKRFAESAKLTDIQYLSDYKEGNFGRSLGLTLWTV